MSDEEEIFELLFGEQGVRGEQHVNLRRDAAELSDRPQWRVRNGLQFRNGQFDIRVVHTGE